MPLISFASVNLFFNVGLNFVTELSKSKAHESNKTLWEAAPVSAPLILVTQVANILSVGFDRVKRSCISVFGHSQGLSAALILASSRDEEGIISLTRFNRVFAGP